MYKCINCELERGGKMFLLNGGKWFEVELDFVEKVNRYIEAIPRSGLGLIPYSHQREDAYLRDATAALGAQCVCMDQDMIAYGGGHSKVEFLAICMLTGGRSFMSTIRGLFDTQPPFCSRCNGRAAVRVRCRV